MLAGMEGERYPETCARAQQLILGIYLLGAWEEDFQQECIQHVQKDPLNRKNFIKDKVGMIGLSGIVIGQCSIRYCKCKSGWCLCISVPLAIGVSRSCCCC
jgi:hypothetical protein